MYLKEISISELQYPPHLQKQCTVFHQKNFLELYVPHIHIVGIFNQSNELTGLFYYFKKSKWGIQYIIPPPFFPHNGLLFYAQAEKTEKQYSLIKELHQHIVHYFSVSEKAHYIRFVLPTNYIDTQVFQWNKWKVTVHYTYHLDLSLSETQLFENLSSEKRKSIRKAEKDNIQIIPTSDYSTIYELVLKTFQRQNKKINTIYLNKILKQWKNTDNHFAFVAYKNGKAIASGFCIFDNHTAYYLLGGYDDSNAHHGAGVSCMWQSILKSKQMGLSVFDFEGSMLPAVERYFRDFGGKLVPYYVCEKKNFRII